MAPGGVLTGKDAVLLNLPELVSAAQVEQAEWSPNGQYVLAARQFGRLPAVVTAPPTVQTSLVLWDRERSRARELWKSAGPEPASARIAWLPGSSTAVVQVTENLLVKRPDNPEPQRQRQGSLLRLDARRGVLQPLGVLPEGTRMTVCPRRPLALLFGGEDRALRIVRADGAVRAVPLALGELNVLDVYWLADGVTACIAGIEPPAEGKKGVHQRWLSFDPATGRAALLAETGADGRVTPEIHRRVAAFEEPAPALPVRLRQTDAVLKADGTSQIVRPLWLEATEPSEEPRVLVAAQSEWGKLSPEGDAVLYSSGGAAWVVAFARTPREVYLAARNAARRAVVVSNMKQAALAVMMWSQDYDGNLPQAGQDVVGLLEPYTKTRAIFDGFIYTYSGGPLSSIQEPSKTLLGYATGPGGRANAFADGHVEWEADR
ncbi:MAG TPA: hypothetical protein VFU47_06405 [Armatimonadota bacterium]|nr:hypothetical protein [Armatimonadota bacterium]